MIRYNLLLTRTGTHCTCQNAIAQESQYWQFAISSIILAFFLNIATFITDIVLDAADWRKMSTRWRRAYKRLEIPINH